MTTISSSNTCCNKQNPFRTNDILFPGSTSVSSKLIRRLVEKISGLSKLAAGYDSLPEINEPALFADIVLKYFNIELQFSNTGLDSIPKQGPVVVVANHPFGGIEGVIMAALMKRIRPDIKIMANSLLSRISELQEIFIPVNPYGGSKAKHENRKPLKAALEWLKQDGLLVVFPAGNVSDLSLRTMRITDAKWDSMMVRLAEKTGADIIPIHFSGKNSAAFYALGKLHSAIKTILLPRELGNKYNKQVKISIGEVVNRKTLQNYKTDDEIAEYLRLHTYMLSSSEISSSKNPTSIVDENNYQEIIDPISTEMMELEISSLPEKHVLAESGALKVYYAHARQIPRLLQEIGRLREVTFRAVGEGTGKAVDIDLYDAYYWHLFIWNNETKEVVGGYRLGCADDILNKYGKKGLYSHSLFKYSRRLLKSINPAIEMGRSFVRPEYQRSFLPLMLLWKGIGQFIVQRPKYAILFGPVSISNDYKSLSQQLLVDFLKVNNFDSAMGRYIKPRKPYKAKMRPLWKNTDLSGLQNIENISELVAVLESDNKGVPILIKQYLKLGGRMLGFNVDKAFADCIDGLIMVDLRQTDPRVLQKYMGKQGTEMFLQYHAEDLQKVS